jgi:pSer/pThr/pTyr-binding forkhead associated (FHA) protein
MSGVVLLIIRILVAGALYLFLGWVVWLIWQDIRRESLSLTHSIQPTLSLITKLNGGEMSRKFHNKEILIGRDAICDLRLEDQTISARHAKLTFRQGQWWLEDLQSKNGTLLNLTAISTPVVVTTDDKIQCGQVEINIRMDADNLMREG